MARPCFGGPMAVWTCETCGRKISAREEVKQCMECRHSGKKTVKAPANKMVSAQEIKQK